MMRSYLNNIVGAAFLVAAATAAINWLVDPYWIFGEISIPHVNEYKSTIGHNQRTFEMGRLRNTSPEVLILGSSREDDSIDPDHPVFAGKSAYNAAISSQPYVEMRRILDMMVEEDHLPEMVVAGLFFEKSNTQTSLPDDYSDDNFHRNQRWKLLFNIHTLADSFKTVATNVFGAQLKTNVDMWNRSGYLYQTDKADIKGYRNAFKKNEKHYFSEFHAPEPYCGYTLVDPNTGHSNMDEIRKFIATLYKEKITATLFIGPSHARQWETIAVSGLWQQFEDWKRQLVNINEEEAAKIGMQPIVIWDFSGYNSVTTEKVPEEGDVKSSMIYYFESSHYSPATGDLVLDRMFDYQMPGRKVPEDFGVRITTVNIEQHLAKIRADREQYNRSHVADIKEIEDLSIKVRQKKHCLTLR